MARSGLLTGSKPGSLASLFNSPLSVHYPTLWSPWVAFDDALVRTSCPRNARSLHRRAPLSPPSFITWGSYHTIVSWNLRCRCDRQTWEAHTARRALAMVTSKSVRMVLLKCLHGCLNRKKSPRTRRNYHSRRQTLNHGDTSFDCFVYEFRRTRNNTGFLGSEYQCSKIYARIRSGRHKSDFIGCVTSSTRKLWRRLCAKFPLGHNAIFQL